MFIVICAKVSVKKCAMNACVNITINTKLYLLGRPYINYSNHLQKK